MFVHSVMCLTFFCVFKGKCFAYFLGFDPESILQDFEKRKRRSIAVLKWFYKSAVRGIYVSSNNYQVFEPIFKRSAPCLLILEADCDPEVEYSQ